MALSEVVQVSITNTTSRVTAKGYGIPLILLPHAVWTDSTEVRRYTDMSGALADFAAGTLGYEMIAAVFSATIRPEAVLVGKLPTPATGHTTRLDFTDHPTGTAIAGTIWYNGTTTALSVPWTTNLATTLAALDTAIEAVTGASTVTTVSPQCTLTTAVGNNRAYFTFTTPVRIVDTTADQGYDTALSAILPYNSTFYYVLADTGSAKNIDKIARWCQSNGRHYGAAVPLTRAADWGSALFTSGTDYTAFLANDAVTAVAMRDRRAFTDCRMVGDTAARDPGSATLAFKSYAGGSPDAWTATDRATLEAGGLNHYTTEAGIAILRPGKTAGADFTDAIIGLDWLQARIAEAIFAAIAAAPKIPYTIAGLRAIEGVLRGVLAVGERQGVLGPGWTSDVRPVAEQTASDRANRIVRGVTFQAPLAGAVHKVIVSGAVAA